MAETICFAYDKVQSVSTHRFLPGMDQLVGMLEEHGLEPVFSVGAAEAFDMEQRAVRVYGFGDTELSSPQDVSLDAVGVILNRADKSLRLGGVAVAMPPTFNEDAVRTVGHYRANVHTGLLEPLESENRRIAVPTLVVASMEQAEQFLLDHPATEYEAKPNVNRGTKGVERLASDEVLASFAGQPARLAGAYLLRPVCDFTGRLPDDIEAFPFDNASKDRFSEANGSEAPKGIRMYAFFGDGQTEMFPVGKIMGTPNKDPKTWFYVKPDSVPNEVRVTTQAIMGRLVESTASRAAYAAVDWGYGRVGNETEHRWVVTEVGSRMPYIPGYDTHSEAAGRLHSMFAGRIAAAAGAR